MYFFFFFFLYFYFICDAISKLHSIDVYKYGALAE